MFRFRLVLFFIILSSCTESFAQDRFGPGYYVNKENDTIRGFIQYKDSYYRNIVFRRELKSKSQHLSATDAKSFSFILGNSYQLINFAAKDALSNQVFAKILFAGAVNLYASHSQFLIGSEQKGHFLLTKWKSSNSSEAIAKYQKNVGAFNVLFFDCPSVQATAHKSAIAEEQLVDILKKYHECRSLKYHEFTPQESRRLRFGFFGGISSTQLSFSGNEAYLNESSFPTSVGPRFGALMLLNPTRKPSSVFNLQVELQYASAEFNATSIYENEVAGYLVQRTSTTTINYKDLIARLGFRLHARSNVVNPYFSFGIGANGFGSVKTHLRQTDTINGVSETTESQPSIKLRGISGWAAVGLKKEVTKGRAFFLDVGFENSPVTQGGKLKVLNARVGYIF